jgi:DNA repair exonuclease SbcCD ATPase subunit
VAGALEAWEALPDEPSLIGPTSAELGAQIAALPEMPTGDLEPDAGVVRARDELVLVQREISRLSTQEPVVTTAVLPAPPEELVAIARDLEVPVPAVAPELESNLAEARAAIGSHSRHKTPLVAAAMCLAVGAALLASGAGPAGMVLLAAGIVTATFGLRPVGPSEQNLAAVDVARTALEIAVRHRAEAQAIRQRATARAVALRLEPDASKLRGAIEEFDRAERAQRERTFWEREIARLRAEEERLRLEVVASLRERGVEPGAEVATAVREYEAACRERSAQAADARQREPLVRQLEVQREAELSVEAHARRRAETLSKVRDVAMRCGVVTEGEPEIDEVIAVLRRWALDRADGLAARAAAWEEYANLQQLLDGMTIDELEQQVVDRSRSAAELASGLDPYELGSVELRSDVKDQIALLRATSNDRRSEGDTARGEAEQARKSLPSVAEAEEEVAAARSELDRVQRLRATLETTRGFLEDAQDSVHRDIAPRLAASVREWLPAITEGRYTDVRVDPENLSVEVLDGTGVWRDAILLSHGTKEQIYLLLRVGLAEHLTKPGEVAPLILDDVTVQFDSRRKQAVLSMLKKLSARHQIILFTQEDEVVQWAEANLSEPTDRLVRVADAVSA